MLFGYFFAPYITNILNPMVDSFRDKVQQGEIKITHDSIFLNNVFVGIMMYCGAILFGLVTATLLISNGVFIGYFATQMPLNAFLAYTLPHGIIEIPAIIIAGASGFVLLKFIISTIYNIFSPNIDEKTDNLEGSYNWTIKNRIFSSLEFNSNILFQSLTLFGVSVVLFVIAAFIEAYLTIPIGNFFI
ncbi:stage II sporulation protein M [Methanobrevibacter sp. TMH8]|nr:stage II sporulation protein M [Methanobrevibacter sp. TMH8]